MLFLPCLLQVFPNCCSYHFFQVNHLKPGCKILARIVLSGKSQNILKIHIAENCDQAIQIMPRILNPDCIACLRAYVGRSWKVILRFSGALSLAGFEVRKTSLWWFIAELFLCFRLRPLNLALVSQSLTSENWSLAGFIYKFRLCCRAFNLNLAGF